MENAHLIVGLGNPGEQYARTRHNAGFLLLEQLAADGKGGWRMEKRFGARLAKARFAGRLCWLCQPQTYMNASGEAVGAVMSYYRVAKARLLVVVDDADLPLGTLRMRPDGSAGGHHGLESVEQHLGSRAYARLRLGIGRQPAAGRQITSHVLGQFDAAEAALFELVLRRGCQAVECWLADGITAAMNQFNGAVAAPDERQAQ
jgi:PTH1 family peptidyl-tRNA hydrolase